MPDCFLVRNYLSNDEKVIMLTGSRTVKDAQSTKNSKHSTFVFILKSFAPGFSAREFQRNTMFSSLESFVSPKSFLLTQYSVHIASSSQRKIRNFRQKAHTH